MMDLLIALKKSVASCGPLKGPRQAFLRLSINPSCFDFKARPPRALDQRGDVIRWSIFDLSRRAASYFLSFPVFLVQDRGYPDSYISDFASLLRIVGNSFRNLLRSESFSSALGKCLKQVFNLTLYDRITGNPIYLVLRLSFGLFLLYVVYRVIKRAITKV